MSRTLVGDKTEAEGDLLVLMLALCGSLVVAKVLMVFPS
jgi:hypothetical protein